MTPATFDGAVGTSWHRPGDDVPFTLTSVRPLAHVGQPRAEPFALDLTRPGEVVAQGIVALRHADLGVLEVFVVPVGRDGDLVRYEVVVN